MVDVQGETMEDFSTFGKTKSSKRDWSAILIFGIFAFLIGMTLFLVLASVVVPKVINQAVDAYTDIAPLAMPDVEYTEEFTEEVEDRVEAFAEALKVEDSPETVPLKALELNEEELNALLHADESLRDTMHLSFEDGRLRTQLSIPLDSDVELGPWRASMRGRYINGIAELELGVGEKGLQATLLSFEASGKPVPGWMLKVLQRELNKEGFLDSDEVQQIMGQLEGIEVVGDRLVFSPKAR